MDNRQTNIGQKERQKRFASGLLANRAFPLVLLLVVANFSELLFAFSSLQKFVVSAGAFVSGFSSNNIRIQHTPLSKASPITQEAIIIGEAGDKVPAVPPPFNTRRTQFSEPLPQDQRKIRVHLEYRYVPSVDTQSQSQTTVTTKSQPPIPFISSPNVEGPDPTAFAFQIPPNAIATGFLEYRIVAERLQLVEGNLDVVAQVTYPPTTSQDSNPFVLIGVQANASEVFSVNGGRFTLVDGNPVMGETALDIPAGVLSGPTTISIDQIPLNSPLIPGGMAQAFAVYHMDADQATNGGLKASFLYPDFTFPKGQDGKIDGTDVQVQNIGVYWWDGFMWRRIGSKIDAAHNLVISRVDALGYFAIAAAAPMSAQDRRPRERIITPNGDGHFDSAVFLINDPSENYKIEIFDITGRRIRTMMTGQTTEWDGRNESGQVVESGVYIYQFRVDGQLVSGLIAVAK